MGAALPVLVQDSLLGIDTAESARRQATLRARLSEHLGDAGDDAARLFAAAQAQLGELEPQRLTIDGVEALLLIAHRHYNAASAQSGVASAARALTVARYLGDSGLIRRAATFHGVLNGETGNLPTAVENYAESLDLARTLGDRTVEAAVWNNLGLALQYAGQFADAARCYDQALRNPGDGPARQSVVCAALTNMAQACLYVHDVRQGIAAARKAIELLSDPREPNLCNYRVSAETHLTELLLEVNDVDGAQHHARLARQFAERSGQQRSQFRAQLAEGQVEVRAGLSDIGLTRLKNGLSKARGGPKEFLREALTAAVKGYEQAGQPDVAIVYLQELLNLNREAKQQQVLMHHQRHLEQVERSRISLELQQAADGELDSRRSILRVQLGERELMKSRIAMLEQQSVAAELHDDTTGEHCYRVGRLASILARDYGLEDDVCFMIDLAARMHDIGKLAVPDSILLKPGRLTDGEREIMQQHTTAGAELLSKSNIPQMHIAEEIARHHHEWWNGKGYPHRLAGTGIPIAARITAVVDVFDALTHVRPYKPAWPVSQAMHEIRTLRGVQFDPDVTDLFMQLIPRLQREVGDLDEYLGAEAKNSPFIQARAKIARALKGEDGSGVRVNFDVRR
jgi:putative two-component system response regulator